MKATRRLVALAAAATMTACAAIPMVAMNVSAATITVTDTTTSGTSTALKAFQIFDAEMAGELFVVKDWGSGINVDALKTAMKADATMLAAFVDEAAIDAITSDATGAQLVADKLSNCGNDSAVAKAFAKIAARCVTDVGTEANTTGESPQFTVDTGYYIIVDTSAAKKGDYTAYTLGILKVVDNTTNLTVTPKRDYPTFDKQIGDRNDTTDVAGTYTYGEAADHDISDAVPFKLIANMPSNIGEYAAYSLKFYDNLQEAVFTLNQDSIKVFYVQSNITNINVEVTTAFNVDTTSTPSSKFEGTGTHTDANLDFTLECTNIKGIDALTSTAGVDFTGQFVVEYTATLTDKAKLGATGNWNGAYLEYSNNPNWDGKSSTGNTKGESPVDYVVAFTYQAIVNKIDGVTQNPLVGAVFTLYKEKNGVTEAVETGITPKYNTSDVSTATSFEFRGLDDGTYVLKEKTVPDGYTGAADITFTITTTKTQTDGYEALDAFASDNSAVTAGNVFTLNAEGNYDNTSSTTLGAVSVTVENKKGSTLPSTGGIGTTIFYVVGSLMVGVAGVYLIAKKRMKNTEQ